MRRTVIARAVAVLPALASAVAANARADLDFDTFSGGIESDMPLTLRSKSKRHLRASLNAPEGAPNTLRFRTFSGDLRLLK